MSGNNTNPLQGTNSPDNLLGGAAGQSIFGAGGSDTSPTAGPGTDADTLNGAGGNDSIWGNDGTDSLIGGDGLDFLLGGDDGDRIVGGADTSDGSGGTGDADTIDGGEEADTIYGGGGGDSIVADSGAADSAGNDRVFAGDGADTVLGGGGADTIAAGADADSVSGGDAGDSIFGDGGDDNLDGGAAGDTIYGGTGSDSVFGNDGGDVLFGGADSTDGSGGVGDNDTLVGGLATGNDTSDTIYGGGGNDLMVGSTGTNQLYGGDGADTLSGNSATIVGGVITQWSSGGSADTLVGGQDNDTYLIGGNDGDSIAEAANAGIDSVLLNTPRSFTLGDNVENVAVSSTSSTGPYTLIGNDLDNSIVGGAGGDSIFGGPGADTMSGNAGNDTVRGGDGNDFFFVGDNEGADSLTSEGGADTLSLAGWTGPQDYGTINDTTYGSWTVSSAGGNRIFTDGNQTVTTTGFEIVICFAEGTDILTAEGEVRVETLRAGMPVATLSGRGTPMKPVLWVGRRRVVLAGNPHAALLAPVRIRAGALGGGAPTRDLLVSPDHCLFIDGVLVPARLLVNGTSITVERGLAEVTYYHVELETHDVLVANGAAAESWLDAGNRAWFENAPVALLRVADAPDAYAAMAVTPCASIVQAGPRLAAIRDAIALHAATAAAARQPARAWRQRDVARRPVSPRAPAGR